MLCYYSNAVCTSHNDHYTSYKVVRPSLVKEQFNSSSVGMCSSINNNECCVCVCVCVCMCIRVCLCACACTLIFESKLCVLRTHYTLWANRISKYIGSFHTN